MARLASFCLEPIGYVRTRFERLEHTPIQPFKAPQEPGRLVVLDEYADGLAGLEQFDYAHLLTFLDRIPRPDRGEPGRLQHIPFMLQGTPERAERVGVFASRFPARPNPIGLSLVRIMAVDGATVEFAGADLLDGTPVLDIKPWEPHLDVPRFRPGTPFLDEIRAGWYARTGAPERASPLAGRTSLEEAGVLEPEPPEQPGHQPGHQSG